MTIPPVLEHIGELAAALVVVRVGERALRPAWNLVRIAPAAVATVFRRVNGLARFIGGLAVLTSAFGTVLTALTLSPPSALFVFYGSSALLVLVLLQPWQTLGRAWRRWRDWTRPPSLRRMIPYNFVAAILNAGLAVTNFHHRHVLWLVPINLAAMTASLWICAFISRRQAQIDAQRRDEEYLRAMTALVQPRPQIMSPNLCVNCGNPAHPPGVYPCATPYKRRRP